MSEATYPFEQANKYHAGRNDQIDYLVVHCTAGLENASGKSAKAVQDMFAHNTRDASAHITVDQVEILRSVHDWDTAWACVYFNANGLHVEIVGLPNQTRAQWLDPISRASIHNAAKVLADWCQRYKIPVVKLTVDHLRQGGFRGITDHADCEKAKPSTGHTDPGSNFPYDVLISDIKSFMVTRPVLPVDQSPLLKIGMGLAENGAFIGQKVKDVQRALDTLGNTLVIDGEYGPSTATIVTNFQKNRRMLATGQMDKPTWVRLRKDMKR